MEVEAAGVHRHGHRAHGRHRLLQCRLAALGHQPDGGAVGRPVLRVVSAAGGVLRGGRESDIGAGTHWHSSAVSPGPPAFPYHGRVGIDVLRVQATIVVHVLEGAGHVAAVAAVVAQLSGAVNEILLTQHRQLPGPVEDEPLQGPCGTERPA